MCCAKALSAAKVFLRYSIGYLCIIDHAPVDEYPAAHVLVSFAKDKGTEASNSSVIRVFKRHHVEIVFPSVVW